MWEPKKITHPSVVVKLEYEDFAMLTVEKRRNKSSVVDEYEVTIDIFDICIETVYMYEFKEVEKCLVFIKQAVEKLYDEIGYYTELEIDQWIQEFEEDLNQY
jgi:hypothetical protein